MISTPHTLSVMVARSLELVVLIDHFEADIPNRFTHNIRFAPDADTSFSKLSASPLPSSPPPVLDSGSGVCPSADIPASRRRRPRGVRTQTNSPRHHNRRSSSVRGFPPMGA